MFLSQKVGKHDFIMCVRACAYVVHTAIIDNFVNRNCFQTMLNIVASITILLNALMLKLCKLC